MSMERTPTVAVLNYGSGNVHSAIKALQRAGAEVLLTADPPKVYEADGLFVPGVGAFEAVMRQLQEVEGPALIEKRLRANKPVFGVCVGQQILFAQSEENNSPVEGLKIFDVPVHRLRASRVPHMGWNSVQNAEESSLFAGVHTKDFYFLHSYAAKDAELRTWLNAQQAVTIGGQKIRVEDIHIISASHENDCFVAAIQAGPLCATQFHPEKSSHAGLQILKNWIASFSLHNNLERTL